MMLAGTRRVFFHGIFHCLDFRFLKYKYKCRKLRFKKLAERVPTAPSARVARASPSLGLRPTYVSRPSASSTREPWNFRNFGCRKKSENFFLLRLFFSIVFLSLCDESVPKPCLVLKSAQGFRRYRGGQDDRQKPHLHFSIRK